jgi:transcriptional regulator GlxA family with amidase domain
LFPGHHDPPITRPADPPPAIEVAPKPEIFVIFVLSDLSMMTLAATIEPLRSLNRLLNRTAYEWKLASLKGGLVATSNGIVLETVKVDEAVADADYIFVCGGSRVNHGEKPAHLAFLRDAARNGQRVGALSTGSYLLARAGILTGYRCTIHWENRPAFKEDFPHLECTNNLFEIDRGRLTCSGGTAAMDLMLYLIEQKHGRELAGAVANQFHHERIRDGKAAQHGGSQQLFERLPRDLQTVIRVMLDHIEDPVAIPDLASHIGLSVRQLQRICFQYTGLTPHRYYIKIRLQQARELLLYSDRSIIEVAVCTGFTSTSHFATCYKRLFGTKPSETRILQRV